MSGPLLLFVGAIYAYVSLDFLREGQGGFALAFAAYSISNVGLWIASR